jgi:hypothetical protein
MLTASIAGFRMWNEERMGTETDRDVFEYQRALPDPLQTFGPYRHIVAGATKHEDWLRRVLALGMAAMGSTNPEPTSGDGHGVGSIRANAWPQTVGRWLSIPILTICVVVTPVAGAVPASGATPSRASNFTGCRTCHRCHLTSDCSNETPQAGDP